ncbi:ATP-dependent DNA helicase PIF1-like [Sitophilus oryzae]|uniref:ATP-dependent DNA helicase n=1 Tax=Sitophilus oryzae TaxID=7048 RepID=A0A6J2Y6E8_SITOR|nr:ATP-dependent DNA helicase PIF1-like [Sitophilus oryzae]
MRQQWRQTEFLIIDKISMVSYQMLCMIDARLRQLKNHEDEFFGSINVLLFGDLLQLPPIKRSGAPVFKQPDHLQPATHLWRLFTLCELTENMRQQGDHTFIEILNALRIGELTANHFSILMQRVIQNPSDEFATDKALRVYTTNQQVNNHNAAVLNLFRNKGSRIYTIKAQDQLIDATRNTDTLNLANIIPTDINKTGGLPSVLEIFVGAKLMLRSNIDVTKGLKNEKHNLAGDRDVLVVQDKIIEQVSQFKYLGMDRATMIQRRTLRSQINKATAMSGCLRQTIWANEYMRWDSKKGNQQGKENLEDHLRDGRTAGSPPPKNCYRGPIKINRSRDLKNEQEEEEEV